MNSFTERLLKLVAHFVLRFHQSLLDDQAVQAKGEVWQTKAHALCVQHYTLQLHNEGWNLEDIVAHGSEILRQGAGNMQVWAEGLDASTPLCDKPLGVQFGLLGKDLDKGWHVSFAHRLQAFPLPQDLLRVCEARDHGYTKFCAKARVVLASEDQDLVARVL